MRLVLLTEWYRAATEVRNRELERALHLNCENQCIAELHSFGTAADLARMPPWLTPVKHAVSGRRTFLDMFEDAGLISRPGDVCVVANADIAFDATIERALRLPPGVAYCLSRWETVPALGRVLSDRADSQDAWFFRAPLFPNVRVPLGTPGGENRLAWSLRHEHGLRLCNPAWSIRAYHCHASGLRTWTEADRVPGPYEFVPPSALCG